MDDSHATSVKLFRGEAAAELLPVEIIAPWEHNPRRTIDPAAIEELAASIGKVGVLQPILGWGWTWGRGRHERVDHDEGSRAGHGGGQSCAVRLSN